MFNAMKRGETFPKEGAASAMAAVRERLSASFGAEKLRAMLRAASHPIDGFYEIRYRGKGSVPLAVVMAVLFSACYTGNRIFASFVVNDVDPRGVDGLMEMSAIFVLLALFTVGNWSVTCLLDGEGRFRDIVAATGYALLPMIVTTVLAALVSQFIANGEEVFYTLIIALGLAWTAMLLLVGVMTVHNYTLLKTLATLILTVLAMFALVFFALLLADMIRQVYVFFYSVYVELVFRA
ncbi:MAG: YIP1 family protein [Oscillospiraceae bacterium]|jgi:hypothetical protein|nr:YIP1 family protein [Oscillospiraceae bacterium]